MELKKRDFKVDRERTIKVWYGPFLVGKHRFDLIVNQIVIIELKANRGIAPVHIAQMRSYLHASSLAFGILLNFGTTALQGSRDAGKRGKRPIVRSSSQRNVY
jgi:GxxExxY protein